MSSFSLGVFATRKSVIISGDRIFCFGENGSGGINIVNSFDMELPPFNKISLKLREKRSAKKRELPKQ